MSDVIASVDPSSTRAPNAASYTIFPACPTTTTAPGNRPSRMAFSIKLLDAAQSAQVDLGRDGRRLDDQHQTCTAQPTHPQEAAGRAWEGFRPVLPLVGL